MSNPQPGEIPPRLIPQEKPPRLDKSGPPPILQPIAAAKPSPEQSPKPIAEPSAEPNPNHSSPPKIALPTATDEANAISQTHRLGAAGPHQRLVYALLARTLFEYRSERILVVLGYLLVPPAILAGMAVGFALTACSCPLLNAAGLGDLLVLHVVVLAFLIGAAIRHSGLGDEIRLYRSEEKLDRFQIGRWEDIFSVASPIMIGCIYGLLFGMQHALLMFTPSHCGLPIEGKFVECLLITLDNVLHGVLTGVCESYVGRSLKHSFFSEAVFIMFRLAFDATALTFGYVAWKRYRLASLFRSFPRDERDVPGVMHWISLRCSSREDWPRRYHDEVIFLLISKAFIAGEFQFVEKLTSELRSLKVDAEVRRLFCNEEGKTVFLESNG